MISENEIFFVARKYTWYDEGTIAILDSDIPFMELLKECGAYFIGTYDGKIDGEYCCLTEFDWIDKKTRECLNSNIPYIRNSSIDDSKPYLITDMDTNKSYNLLENKEV